MKFLIYSPKKNEISPLFLTNTGAQAGMITLEDVIEEIFGEIKDEHDSEAFLEKEIRPNEWLFSTRLEVSDVNEKWNLTIPESDNYNTLGGYILDLYESIPVKGTVIKK